MRKIKENDNERECAKIIPTEMPSYMKPSISSGHHAF